MLSWLCPECRVSLLLLTAVRTCRGCNCSFNELVQLAQVMIFPATWVTDLIRIPHGILNYWQSNFFTNFG